MSARAWTRTWGALAVLLVAGGFFRLVSYRLAHDYAGNYSGFLQIGHMFDRNPVLPRPEAMRASVLVQDSDGYDGQFMYFMTFDPFLRRFHADPGVYRNVVDMPPYRYGRIGLSVLTKIVSLDRWRRYPAATIWIILSSLVVCAVGLGVLASRNGANPGWAAVVLLVPAFWISVQTGLPEPVAAAFAVSGFVCVVSGRWLPGAVLLACSLLVRETGVLFVLCVAGWTAWSGQRRQAWQLTLVALAPIVLWRLYVGVTLSPSWGTEAFFYRPDDFGLPFAGIVELGRHVARGDYWNGSKDMVRAAITFPAVLIMGLLFAVVAAVRRPSGVTLSAVAYGGLAMLLNFGSVWVHVGNAQRTTFELFVMLALTTVTVSDPPRLLRVLRTTFWTLSAGYVLYGGFDAPFLRQVLLPRVW